MSSSGGPPETDRAAEDGYDRIEPAELAATLAAWDLPTLQSVEPFDRGSRRAPKLRLVTDGGVLLLKRRQPEQAGPLRVAFAHAALSHLAARGVPVAAPLPDRRGRTAVRRPAGCYELFPFLPGRRPRPDARSADAAGGMLARMHEAAADFQPPGPAEAGSWHAVAELPRTLDAVPRRVRRIDPGIDEADLARCCRFLTRAYGLASERAAEAMAGPARLVHGDWHPGNLLAHDGRLTAVLDFDAARLEPRITDVANACLQFAVDRPTEDPRQWPGVLAYERIRAVIAGYERVAGPLADAERAALPWLMIEALVIESVVPIAREGRFGRFSAATFLPMVERKVRWLHERSDRLVDYLAEPAE